ncbi:MAG: efflux RND transporter permease subunit [Alphaproteobacteria bacterium]|nr:efflux RND transporter permease subunit [Alphaproteobacteria bacterium]
MSDKGLQAGGIMGLVGKFLENPVMTNLLMIFFIVGGLMTAVTMRSEVFPTVDVGTISISVPYPGATPLEVEDSITRRVEEAVLGITGVERVRSYAYENRAALTLELEDFVDAYRVKDEVQAAIDSIVDFPPGNAEEPVVTVTQSLSNALTLVLVGQVGERELRAAAELLERDLLALDTVSAITVRGARTKEISIELSEATLRKYDLTFREVAEAIRNSSIELSGGVIKTSDGEILLRTDAKARVGDEFERITVRSSNGGDIVRLSDIATVKDGFADEDLINEYNGVPAILLDILRNESSDILDVKAKVMAYVDDAALTLPKGVQVLVFRDQTEILADRISLLTSNALLGFALVFLLLVATLDLKLAFWVAMGIPISFLGGFLIFGSMGITLNMVTMFALIVVIGIVVDDAIVVGENIYAEQQHGHHEERAAFEGVKNIYGPVLVGVFTTMAAFAPLLFQTGTFAKITRPIPVAVIAILAVSLVEAFFILPSHLRHENRWSKGLLRTIQQKVARGLDAFAIGSLQRLIVRTSQYRYATVAATVGLMMICFALVGNGFVRVVFFPNIEGTEISAKLAMPDGAPFEATAQTMEQLESAIKQVAAEIKAESGEDVIKATAVTVGARYNQASGPGSFSSALMASHLGQMSVELVPTDARSYSAREIGRRWELAVGPLPGVETLSFASTIGPQSVDVGYELAHDDQHALEAAAAELANRLATIGGVNQIDAGLDLGKRQYEFTMTDLGLAAGLKPADLARQLRQAYFGEEVQRIQRGREEVKVYVRYPAEVRRSLEKLSDVRIRLPDGSGVPLSLVADITEGRSPTSIERVNGRRVLTVTADVDEAVTTPNVVNDLIQAEILPALMTKYSGLRWQLEGGSREQSEDFASLFRGFMLAVIIIYALVATQLKSYVQPMIILVSIPLGIAGAILGHMLLGYDLSFVSLFGVVALAGVVVNASVVLIDRYNIELKQEDATALDAAVRATLRRFRPIALTTITTALGLLPIISETSPQAQFLIPMAVSLATGLLFSSFVMLFALPALILVIEDVRGFFSHEHRQAALGKVASDTAE